MLREKNITAYALHIKSGLHQSVISKIKRNMSKALQLDVLDTLCKALDCQPGELMTCENEDATQAVNTQSVNTTQIVERATQNVNTQNVDTTQNASDNDIIGSIEAGRILGINQSLVIRYAKDGRLKGLQGRKGSKRNVWTFCRSDVLEFMPT